MSGIYAGKRKRISEKMLRGGRDGVKLKLLRVEGGREKGVVDAEEERVCERVLRKEVQQRVEWLL